MYSVSQAIDKFKEIIGTKSTWTTLVNTQFVDHLATFVSWCLRDAQWKVERAKQEMFIATALDRSSLIAHVEDRDYIPRKPSPATGSLTIKNNGANRVTLPLNSEFYTDSQVFITTTEPIIIEAGQSTTVECGQFRLVPYTFTVEEEKSFYEIILDLEITRNVADFSVEVDENDTNGFRQWENARLLQNTFPESRVYDEFYSHSDRIGLRFGNGNFGRIVPINSTVRVSTKQTDGNVYIAHGQQVFPVSDILDSTGNDATIEASVERSFTGGLNGETLEEIRDNLHYWPTFNEDLVWADDYCYFLKRRFPNIVFCQSWGEQEAEEMAGAPSLDLINKIFICAYSKLYNETLPSDALTALAGVRMLNRKFEWVEPVHVLFTVTISGKILPDVILSEAINDIRASLNQYYGKDSVERRNTVYLSEIYDTIQSTGYFSTSSGAMFDVVLAGQHQQTYLYEMVSIDLDNSTFNLSY